MSNFQESMQESEPVFRLVNSEYWPLMKDKLAHHMVSLFSVPHKGTFEEIGMTVVANNKAKQIIDEFITGIEGEAEQYTLDKKALEEPKNLPTIVQF